MVKYGLFAAQQAQEQSSHSLSSASSPSSNPVLFPGVDARCSFTLLMLALLGNYIIHGMSGRSVHNSLSLPGRISLFAFGAAKVEATPGQGDSQLGTLGFPREEKRVLMHPWLQDETSEGIFLSPHQLCCAYSTILLLICRTAIEGRQQRNEGIASQFPSVANKIHQALWENQELYLQSASFYLLRDKQG